MKRKAFSFIELSIVILITGILIAGITQGSRLVREFRIQTARNLTKSSPIPLIKDMVLWLETSGEESVSDADLNFILEEGANVQNWYDANVHSLKKHFAANASATSPTYKLNGIHSLPSISFDESLTQFLQSPLSPLRSGDTSYTIATVSRISPSASAQPHFIFSQSGSSFADGSLASIIYDGNIQKIGFSAGGININLPLLVGSDTDAVITVAVVDGNTVSVYGNSSYFSTSITNNGPNGNITRIGAASYDSSKAFSGEISEIIIFDRPLKTQEVESIRSYLGKKYDIDI